MVSYMITTKPVVCLRASESLVSFLEEMEVYDTILNIFNVKKLVLEEEEVKKFSEIMNKGLPVISLAKHLKGDFNLSYSRCYNARTLTFLNHITSPEISEDSIPSFNTLPRHTQVILFDEDIGGGYLIKKLTRIFREDYSVELIPETFVKFDPKFQEVLDLKDFIYKFSDTSGLVVDNGNSFPYRVPYMITPEVLEKFASIAAVYLDNFGTYCWVLSFLYHYYKTNNQTYMLDCYTQLTKVYKWNLPTNTESMKEFCHQYLKLYF